MHKPAIEVLKAFITEMLACSDVVPAGGVTISTTPSKTAYETQTFYFYSPIRFGIATLNRVSTQSIQTG